MRVWIVVFLAQVGDEEFDSVFSTEALAKAYLATKEIPGHWRCFSAIVDDPSAT